uniref:Uncharacterized protein yyzM n=1 Tax=Anthurium amnicola TaxID=1678845 RepID=A0A1D1Z7T9_9ARAE
MSSEKEQVRPLAPGGVLQKSPAVADASKHGGDVEVGRPKPSKRRRRAVRCCACCGVTVVVLGIVILVLALTVFKVKDPVMTMNSLTLAGINAGVGSRIDRLLQLNATVVADISIKNPNAASFRFHNSTTEFYYQGETVGVAYAPSGTARARRTVRMNVTVDVFADRVAAVANANPGVTVGVLMGDAVSLNLSTYTGLSGRVNVWGIYKRNLDIRMNCTMTLEYVMFTRQEITNRVCKASVK